MMTLMSPFGERRWDRTRREVRSGAATRKGAMAATCDEIRTHVFGRKGKEMVDVEQRVGGEA